MGNGKEVPRPAKSDKPGDTHGRASDSATLKGWNDRALVNRRGGAPRERGGLSPEEAAERRSRARPEHGVGFDFGKSELPTGEFERWMNGLSPKDRALLKQPGTRFEVWASASRPGSREFNQTLSDRRADAVSKKLQERLGIPKEAIKADGFGEDPARDNLPEGADPRKFEGKDHRNDRVAEIVIVPKESETPARAPKSDAAAREGRKAADGARVDEPSPKYSPEEGLRDLPKFVKDKKKVVFESVKRLVSGIHELHTLNEQASHRSGIEFGARLISIDSAPSDKNAHVEQGKPYTADELWDRLHKSDPLKGEFYAMTGHLIMNRGSLATARKGMKEVADRVNTLLRGARTPAERRAVLREFTRAVLEGLQKNARQPSR